MDIVIFNPGWNLKCNNIFKIIKKNYTYIIAILYIIINTKI